MRTVQVACIVLLLGGWGETSPAAGGEDFGGLPPGPGREEVYAACAACHSIKLVVQQRLNRDFWDETLDYMVKEQAMPELEADERAVILDYLSTYLSATTPR